MSPNWWNRYTETGVMPCDLKLPNDSETNNENTYVWYVYRSMLFRYNRNSNNRHFELSVSFFRTALKCIYRYNEIEIGGWSTPFVSHAFLCREKRQKIEDIKKNIRDAILVRIIPFSIFVYAIQFHISRGIQHSFKIMSNCLFLFHCVDLIIIILRHMHKA